MVKHIGGANLKDSLNKEQLKELIQVLGTLGTKAALPILSKFEREVCVFIAEKGRLNVRPGPRFTPGPGPGPQNILNSLNLLSMILLSICQVRVSSDISTIMIRRQKSE